SGAPGVSRAFAASDEACAAIPRTPARPPFGSERDLVRHVATDSDAAPRLSYAPNRGREVTSFAPPSACGGRPAQEAISRARYRRRRPKRPPTQSGVSLYPFYRTACGSRPAGGKKRTPRCVQVIKPSTTPGRFLCKRSTYSDGYKNLVLYTMGATRTLPT